MQRYCTSMITFHIYKTSWDELLFPFACRVIFNYSNSLGAKRYISKKKGCSKMVSFSELRCFVYWAVVPNETHLVWPVIYSSGSRGLNPLIIVSVQNTRKTKNKILSICICHNSCKTPIETIGMRLVTLPSCLIKVMIAFQHISSQSPKIDGVRLADRQLIVVQLMSAPLFLLACG